MFLVNIPMIFSAVWRVLSMFVDDRVKAKIRFLRKADFYVLHEFVDRDILPVALGGKNAVQMLSDKIGMRLHASYITWRRIFAACGRLASSGCRVLCHAPCLHAAAATDTYSQAWLVSGSVHRVLQVTCPTLC